MKENQLGLAMRLWYEMKGKTIEEVSKYLSKEMNIDKYQTEKFLSGDPNRMVCLVVHNDALTEWVNKRG